jgi:hypothetical protein
MKEITCVLLKNNSNIQLVDIHRGQIKYNYSFESKIIYNRSP